MTPKEIEEEIQKETALLESMLKPISGESPAGADIRDDSSPTSPYYTIKDARNSARAAERKNAFDGDGTEADPHWRKVENLAPEILQNLAKDLEIASWYTEARTRRSGFIGLLTGLKLIHGLVENYWDNLYPLPDEYGIETRVSSLSGLSGEGTEGVLIPPINNTKITQGNDPGPFSLWQYQQALSAKNIADNNERAAKEAKLGFDISAIDKAVLESSEHFFVHTRNSISTAIETFSETARLLHEYCGAQDAPSTSNILEVLEECLGAVRFLGKDKFPVEATDEPEVLNEDTSSDTSGTTQISAGAAGPTQSRDDAFRKINEIADYFRTTEPHSPISYILDRAVKWGEMPLEKLMGQLIEDGPARDTYRALTGINVADGNSDEDDL